MAPLMKPRTLWACHPVAAMRSFRVAPFGWRSSARIAAFLLPSRAPWPSVVAFFRPLALLVALVLAARPVPTSCGGAAFSPRLRAGAGGRSDHGSARRQAPREGPLEIPGPVNFLTGV